VHVASVRAPRRQDRNLDYSTLSRVAGVRPYRCSRCEKAFTQRCSLESHERKLHGVLQTYGFKQRRGKLYVCEECGFASDRPADYHTHITDQHPHSAAVVLRRRRQRAPTKTSSRQHTDTRCR